MAAEMLPSTSLTHLLEDIAKREGFVEPRLSVSTATKPGDNFQGVLYRVVVSDSARPERESLSLIVKTMPLSRKRRQEMLSQAHFSNEALAYTKVLAGFAEFLRGRGQLNNPSGVCPSTARCFAARLGEEESSLVLQDMRPLGFVMADRRKPMDLAHLRLGLQKLAELHATSLAVEKVQPKQFAEALFGFTENIYGTHNPVRGAFNQSGWKSLERIEHRFPKGSVGYAKAKALLTDAVESLRLAVQPDPDGGNVFMHGDSWANNLLFKYSQPGGEPEDLCFVDFQLSRYGPTVIDVLFLLYASTERSLRQLHYQDLLRGYHAHLTRTADRLLGGEAGAGARLYPWAALQRQLKRSGRFAFGMVAMFLPIYMGDSDEAKDPDACFEQDGSAAQDVFVVQSEDPDRDNRIADVLEDMLELGYM